MNRKQLIDNLLRNWPAKVICFTIAIFLYLFYQASLIEKKTYVVPLEVYENGLVVHVNELPTSVVISIRANENDIKAIFAGDMKASVNLNNIVESGEYRIPVEVTISDKLLGMDPLEVKLKDEKIKVVVEKRISKYLKVEPTIIGEVAENYRIKDVIMDPPSVKVVGPESLVNSIDCITTKRVIVSNAKTNFTAETSYNEVSELVEIDENPVSRATVIVEPIFEDREYFDVPITIRNLSEKFEMLNELPVYNLKLRGDIPSFNEFDIKKNPVILDLGQIKEPGKYDVPIHLSLPPRFELISSSFDTVKVLIVEKGKVAALEKLGENSEIEKDLNDTDSSDKNNNETKDFNTFGSFDFSDVDEQADGLTNSFFNKVKEKEQ